jgi:cleavage and polyadenylation specificity factor subunit 1
MQCYTELVPPTAVNASIALPFLSATANNLVVAKDSLLQIFAPKSVVSDEVSTNQEHLQTNGHSSGVSSKKERIHTTKLVLVSQVNVAGIITDLARIKSQRSKSGGELLLVAARDAKLSLVEWDPEKHSISTVSIHYYEREDLQGAPWAPSMGQNINCLTVDAASRCAAFKFGARSLAIIPFHQAGDDLVMDDMDNETRPAGRNSIKTNGEPSAAQTPYSASFVLSLLTLDPALKFPIHMAFLQGYREPTLGILSSQVGVSAGLLRERKDPVNFTVYTLDVEQRASTTLLSVTGLPYDIYRVLALPGPIGGALLIGSNEFIHVDQGGKANGVAVNEFAKQCTAFPLVQQDGLDLKLEGCTIEQLGTTAGDMLVVLGTGGLAVLSFKLDGRAVGGLSVHVVSDEKGGALLPAAVSCVSTVGRGRVFLGSEDWDSVVLGWNTKTQKAKVQRQKSKVEENDDDMDLDLDYEDEEDENDLYAEVKSDNRQDSITGSTAATSPDEYAFRIHDRLTNIAPLANAQLMSSRSQQGTATTSSASLELDLLATSGRGKTSALIRLSPQIRLQETQALELADVQRVWSLHSEMDGSSDDAEEHNIVVTSTAPNAATPESHAYRFSDGDLKEFDGADFEVDAGATIEIATMLGGTRVVQVLLGEVRTFDAGKFLFPTHLCFSRSTFSLGGVIALHEAFAYMPGIGPRGWFQRVTSSDYHCTYAFDRRNTINSCSFNIVLVPYVTMHADHRPELNLTQILPLSDEMPVTASHVPASMDTGVRQPSVSSPPRIMAASIAEPYILLTRDDNSVIILKADDAGDLEEVDKGEHIGQTKWVSGSLYDDVNDAFHLEAADDGDDEEEEFSSMLMFLVDVDGGLQVRALFREYSRTRLTI